MLKWLEPDSSAFASKHFWRSRTTAAARSWRPAFRLKWYNYAVTVKGMVIQNKRLVERWRLLYQKKSVYREFIDLIGAVIIYCIAGAHTRPWIYSEIKNK